MKGLMVTLLVLLLTGTVYSQQASTDSTSDFSLRGTQPNHRAAPGTTQPRSNGQVDPNSARNAANTGIGADTGMNPRQPFKLPMAPANIELMKKQGFIFSRIPAQHTRSVNGIVLTDPARTESSLSTGKIKPTIDRDGILHFEVDDYAIRRLKSADFEFEIPPEYQGKYDFVVLDYRENHVEEGTASKPISRASLIEWSNGGAPATTESDYLKPREQERLVSEDRFRNPLNRNPLDQNPDRNRLQDNQQNIVRTNNTLDRNRRWNLPGDNPASDDANPRWDNRTDSTAAADRLARDRWLAQEEQRLADERAKQRSMEQRLADQRLADQRLADQRLADEIAQQRRGTVGDLELERRMKILDQQYDELQREKLAAAKLKQELLDLRARNTLDSRRDPRFADSRFDESRSRFDTTRDGDLARQELARRFDDRLNASTVLDREAREMNRVIEEKQNLLRQQNATLDAISKQVEDNRNKMAQLQRDNQNYNRDAENLAFQNQLRYGNQNDRTRFASSSQAPNLSMTIPATTNNISRTSANGVRKFGKHLENGSGNTSRGNDKTAGALWVMLLFSLGLNIYLWWLARGFYVRYAELADELRETFTATM